MTPEASGRVWSTMATTNKSIRRLNIFFLLLLVFGGGGLVAGCILSRDFLLIVSKGDNIPIVGMMFLVGYYTWLALKQAFLADQRIEEGRRDLIYDDMCD